MFEATHAFTRRIVRPVAALGLGAGLLGLVLTHSAFPTSAAAQDGGERVTGERPSAALAEPAYSAEGKPAGFQTGDQLQKAGVKRCLQLAQALGQATMVGTSEYAAASTWHSKEPDQRFSVSMIGQKFGASGTAVSNGVSGVFSAPTAEGRCDAAAVQIIPTSESCSKTQAQILQNGRALGNLAGVPLLQNAANAQVMLIPAANDSCVLVALSTVYTE